MRILIVGAGQVGIVYGYYAAKAGAHVAYYVRDKYVAESRTGFHFYPLNQGKKAHDHFIPAQVSSNWTELGQTKWDWVFIAVPSPSLQQPWFEEMKRVIADTPVVALQLGMHDSAWLEQQLGKGRVFYGMINLIAYAVPLEGHPVARPGTAVWFPPFSAMPFSGPDRERLAALAKLFDSGGMRSGVVSDTGATVRFPDFLLNALVSALELVGWRFKDLNRTADVKLAIAAAEEQNAILDMKQGTKRPLYFSILQPWFMRLVMWLGAKILPLPLEPYIRVHFLKVNAQFQRGRQEMMAEGKRLGLSTLAIAELDRRLAEKRRSPLT